jgi:hypothetical protein
VNYEISGQLLNQNYKISGKLLNQNYKISGKLLNQSYSQWQQPQRTCNNSRSMEDEEFNVSVDSLEHSYYSF